MSAVVAREPRVVRVIAGRLRVRLPGWAGQGRRSIETRLRRVEGVRTVQANALTGSVLIQFDPAITNEQKLLKVVRALDLDTTSRPGDEPPPPPTLRERHGRTIRARIAVRGLDRDPLLAKRVVEHLERHPGVRASANLLTGRVLVEFAENAAILSELIAEVSELELPALPAEDRPAHPLDTGSLMQSATRASGAGLGLGLLAARQLVAAQEPLPGASGAAYISSVIGIVQGIPFIRYGLRKLLGRTLADLLFNIPGITMLTLANSPLGLALTGGESLRLLTEAHARRTAWRRHEERLADAAPLRPDGVIHLEAGECTPLPAEVLEGTGTSIGRDGQPSPIIPGSRVPPGARLYGGPFVLKLRSGETFEPFIPEPRPAPVAPALYDRYQQTIGPLSLLYAAATALLTRSFSQSLVALLLVNPRTAAIGLDSADLGASARLIRAGVTVVGTRPRRMVRLPHFVLLDGARLLTDRLELISVLPLIEGSDTNSILVRAAGVAVAACSPWGEVFRAADIVTAHNGSFDGKVATADFEGIKYTLGPIADWGSVPEAAQLRQRGNYVLVLRCEHEKRPLGVLALRPKLAPGVEELVQICQRHGVQLAVLSSGDQIASQALAYRANITLLAHDDALTAIRAKQKEAALVAFVSDNAGAAAGFAASDLAIGLTDDRTHLPAPADLLAPDLIAVTAIIETAARREATVRDSVGLSALSNIIGAVWGFTGMPVVALASRAVYLSALSALIDGWLRLRNGNRPGSTLSYLFDPRPERWGRRSIEMVLRTLHTAQDGLTSAQAAERKQQVAPQTRRNRFLAALLEQLRSPLIGMLAAGAGLSLFLGAIGDVIIIATTITASVATGAWQERKADRVAESLKLMGVSHARVLRDNRSVVIPADEVVPGDVLLLVPGDRVGADARVLSSQGLEADEAALTGESLPVSKMPEGGTEANRIVLEGSNITAGTGRAVVVAVGRQTLMGATAAALSVDETEQSPLGVRLSRMLRVLLPLSIAGGVTVVASGLLRGHPLTSLLATGVTMVLACVPEGLPLLTRVGEAGIAQRLARHNALVRRLPSVEALGRVDVACTDKTGTLTSGHLTLNLVADSHRDAALPGELPVDLRHVLLTAALASPHPDAPGASVNSTDVAVIRGAQDIGLDKELRVKHEAERSFDSMRFFHATVARGRLCVKGAPEGLFSRCSWVLRNGEKRPMDQDARLDLLAHSRRLFERGLRVLMVAEGPPDASLEDPQGLTALGFVGISDALRPEVRTAVSRCRNAGVRVIMITGDHPSTARTIAREAGLLDRDGAVLSAPEIAQLSNDELDERLEHVSVIARATPMDKLRIVESLQRRGHTVAMTGDGVNDAPALRLADIGVAMGRGGMEVARQTADVVLADDNFSTLVETFVEGRSFWRNIRRALGLLLGGNLGELGLVVGASLLGFGSPLTARQILAMNAITDILPALAITLQRPEHRNLAALEREGVATLTHFLRNDIVRRAIASAAPSLAAYLLTLGFGLPVARSVAFASIVTTQLAQTLDSGQAEGTLTRSVLGAVAGSAGVLLATFAIPALRTFLNLVIPPPLGWMLIGAGSLVAVLLSRLLSASRLAGPALPRAVSLPAARSATAWRTAGR